LIQDAGNHKEASASAVSVDADGVIRIALSIGPAVKPANDAEEVWVPSEALQRFLIRTESG
jgi:hypothetical protein